MAQRILALELVGDRVRAAAAERSWNSFTLTGVYDKIRADGDRDRAHSAGPAAQTRAARIGRAE